MGGGVSKYISGGEGGKRERYKYVVRKEREMRGGRGRERKRKRVMRRDVERDESREM